VWLVDTVRALTQTRRFKAYEQCVVGAQLYDWLLARLTLPLCASKQDAKRLAGALACELVRRRVLVDIDDVTPIVATDAPSNKPVRAMFVCRACEVLLMSVCTRIVQQGSSDSSRVQQQSAVSRGAVRRVAGARLCARL
jgi:hypothetical protein